MRPRKRVAINIENDEIACHVRMLLREGSLYKLADDDTTALACVSGLGASGVAVSRIVQGLEYGVGCIIVPYDANFAKELLLALEIACRRKRGPKSMPKLPYARDIGARAGERYAKEDTP